MGKLPRHAALLATDCRRLCARQSNVWVTPVADAFDYIIVGAGSAGSLLSERLSADGRLSICVLEAGPPDRNPFIQVPVGFIKTLFDPRLTWQFHSEPNQQTAGRRIHLAQGRTLGGSSAINGGVYVRGQRGDFDGWAQRGNPGWSYADVLPYFRRAERRWGEGDDQYRGREGALHVTTPVWPNVLCDAFMQSAVADGFPANPDYNGAAQEGVGRYQAAIYRGRRVSAAKAFLHPARRRPNVEVRTHTLVTRVRVSAGRAAGVEYRDRAGVVRDLTARRGVIVSAGAANSPKLLQLSGIGPQDLLRSHGIEVVHHLPGVGENLQDHFSPRLVFLTKGADSLNNHVRGLPLARQVVRWLRGKPSVLALTPAICHAFGKPDPSLSRPDFTFVFMPASYKAGRVGVLDTYAGMTCGVWQMRPESRGKVRIRSAEPGDAPTIDPAYLTAEADCRTLVAALKRARQLFEHDPIKSFVDQATLPGPDVRTDEEWLDFARHYGSSSYHLVGSCRMGPASDVNAVVGSDLRVHGVDALYVVDSSVMPTIPSANTYAATLMIADKASDLILGRSPFSPSAVADGPS